jgi:hypothetical protein
MPESLDKKTLKLKQSDIHARVSGNLTALLWKNMQDIHILRNMHRSPTEGNFCDEQEKAQKPVIVTNHNQHMGYVDRGDRVADSSSFSWRTWK